MRRRAQGTLRPISPQAFVLNLVSMVVYPFAARPFVMAIMGMDDARFAAMMQERKTELPDVLPRGAPAMSRYDALGLLLVALAASAGARAEAQSPTVDSLRLDVLYAAAQQHDPRTRELALRESQAALHLRTIANELLPAVSATQRRAVSIGGHRVSRWPRPPGPVAPARHLRREPFS